MIERRLRDGREREEVLHTVLEACEISNGGDPSGNVGIEKTFWNGTGAVNNEFKVCGVDGSIVEGGDGVEIALLKADGFLFTGSSSVMGILAGNTSYEAGAEHEEKNSSEHGDIREN